MGELNLQISERRCDGKRRGDDGGEDQRPDGDDRCTLQHHVSTTNRVGEQKIENVALLGTTNCRGTRADCENQHEHRNHESE